MKLTNIEYSPDDLRNAPIKNHKFDFILFRDSKNVLSICTSGPTKRARIVYTDAPLPDYLDLMISLIDLLYIYAMFMTTELTRLAQLARRNITREPYEMPINAYELRQM
jgi:hypothetical protein